MKKLVSLFVLGLSVSIFAQHDHSMHKKEMQDSLQHPMIHTGEIDVKKLDKNEDGKVWECPMDWNVISDEMGRCPVCEMKLKEYTIKQTEQNLIKFGHHVKGHKMMHDNMKKDKEEKPKGSAASKCKGDCCK